MPKCHAKLEHECKLKQEENGADEANTLRHCTWTKDEDEVIRGWTDIKNAGKIFKKYFPARSENGGRNRMKCLREEATRAGWTNERDQKLRECRDETGAGWDEEVLRLNFPNESMESLNARWDEVKTRGQKGSQWSKEEDAQLLRCIDKGLTTKELAKITFLSGHKRRGT